MRIGAAAIVRDDHGRVLLHRRDDTRTWGIPGGAIEIGELPPQAVIREVREETGLEVEPASLMGLFFLPWPGESLLSFTFRCRLVGGTLRSSAESPELGFFPVDDLPWPMTGIHEERLKLALSSKGPEPVMLRQTITPSMHLMYFVIRRFVYPYKNLRRRLRGDGRYVPPPSWQAGAFCIIRDAEGNVLWVKRTDYNVWNLPGGGVQPGEAPWEAAIRETREETGLDVGIASLSGAYFKPPEAVIVFQFRAEVLNGELRTGAEAAAFTYFPPGLEPRENCLPKQIERVADVASDETVFRVQSGPAGLVALGFQRTE